MKATRWMAVFDTHGKNQDDDAVSAALAFRRHWKPEIRIHGGDIVDLPWLRDGASPSDRAKDIAPDLDAGFRFGREYGPTHLLLGNHEYRAWRDAEHPEGERRATTKMVRDALQVAAGDARIYPYDKKLGVMRLGGDHVVIHGNLCGDSATRRTALVYGNVLFGHLHRIERATVPALVPRTGYCCGCLCRLDMSYTAGDPGALGWQHGFAYGFIRHGKVTVFQAEKRGKEWFLPTEFKSF